MFEQLRPALIITRREIRDQFRDWRIIVPILILTLIFPAIMNFTARRAVVFVEQYGASIIGERLIPFLLMVVGFFPISISLVIALESFVGEKERRSIEPLLSSPMTDVQLYVGKLLAVTVPPLLASYIGIIVYLVGVYRQIGWVAEPILLVQIVLLTTVQAIVMVAGAVVISTQATSVRAANLLASFIIIPMAFLIQGESMVMFWAEYDALWSIVFGLVVLAAVLVRTGVSHFNREEMLGRELDTLNVKGTLRLFLDEFKGNAASIGEWYRVEVLSTMKHLRQPILFVLGVLAISLFVGGGLSRQFPLPSDILSLESVDLQAFADFGAVRLLSPEGVPVIWFHNLRAIVLALLLGMFSFSVLGILILMLPMILIGYFAASFSAAGISPVFFLTAFVLPHGILEIPAIAVAGAGILAMGARIVAPSDGKSIGDVFVIGLAEWSRAFLGVAVPLFFLAAILEVFLTPWVAVALLN